jgi:hypothetical protein
MKKASMLGDECYVVIHINRIYADTLNLMRKYGGGVREGLRMIIDAQSNREVHFNSANHSSQHESEAAHCGLFELPLHLKMPVILKTLK